MKFSFSFFPPSEFFLLLYILLLYFYHLPGKSGNLAGAGNYMCLFLLEKTIGEAGFDRGIHPWKETHSFTPLVFKHAQNTLSSRREHTGTVNKTMVSTTSQIFLSKVCKRNQPFTSPDDTSLIISYCHVGFFLWNALKPKCLESIESGGTRSRVEDVVENGAILVEWFHNFYGPCPVCRWGLTATGEEAGGGEGAFVKGELVADFFSPAESRGNCLFSYLSLAVNQEEHWGGRWNLPNKTAGWGEGGWLEGLQTTRSSR